MVRSLAQQAFDRLDGDEFSAMKLAERVESYAQVYADFLADAPTEALEVETQLTGIPAGRMRVLAVAGARRSPALPEVPTVSEAGVPGFDASTWYGMLAPARTPREVVGKLHGEIVRILQQRDVRERLSAMGVETLGSTPEQLARHIASELPKWSRVVKQSGARVD